ncbi:MAG: hypothetical protein K1X95_16455, partial [Acidimicrobiia bacterium]|nr:hypothetical protein [Acidimicrobiia bacterium]
RVRRPSRPRSAAPAPVQEPAATNLRPECYACPIGMAFGTVRDASPETMDHLVAASRELVSAARSVMQALEANLERYSQNTSLQHIDVE